MSTFVVRFFEERSGCCRGRIRHVASGEETAFSDERGLLAFIDRMKFLGTLVRDGTAGPDPLGACEPDREEATRPAVRRRTAGDAGRRSSTGRGQNRVKRGGLS